MNKKLLKEYFKFNRRERIGIAALLVLMLGIAWMPSFFKMQKATASAEMMAAYKNDLEVWRQRKTTTQLNDSGFANYPMTAEKEMNVENKKAEVFYFDPNTASLTEWKKLGVREKTALTIQKYLSKGGKFRKAEDINKVFGLSDDDKKRLLPYVRIRNSLSESVESNSSKQYNERKLADKKIVSVIEINNADSMMLVALPGIGQKLAARIINFRNKLGGFYEVSQVGETFGLPDSTFQAIRPKLICNKSLVRKININTASVEVLKQHPYIRWNLANMIVMYRNQHGNYASIEDISKVGNLQPEQIAKLLPYLSVD